MQQRHGTLIADSCLAHLATDSLLQCAISSIPLSASQCCRAVKANLCAICHPLSYMLPALQGYAWEITTAEGGWGLDGVLRERSSKLNGITNGIDMDEWDPSRDQLLASTYSSSHLSGVPAPCRLCVHEACQALLSLNDGELGCQHLVASECMWPAKPR